MGRFSYRSQKPFLPDLKFYDENSKCCDNWKFYSADASSFCIR
jgi:hypothetical protein